MSSDAGSGLATGQEVTGPRRRRTLPTGPNRDAWLSTHRIARKMPSSLLGRGYVIRVTFDWLIAFGTILTGFAAVAGLMIAGQEVKLSRQQREDELGHREAERAEYRLSMARAFGLSVTRNADGMRVTVHNAGSLPVEAARVFVGHKGLTSEEILNGWHNVARDFYPRTVLPGDRRNYTANNRTEPRYAFPVVVTFTDAWGQTWAKFWEGDLVPIEKAQAIPPKQPDDEDESW